MGSKKDVRDLVKELRKFGLEVKLAKNGHWKVWRGSEYLATLPNSPSDGRSLLNAIATLRRLDVDVKRK